ncbi:MAG: GGDEF domain-containing protein [Pseudomonadota bacterium]
MDFQRYRLNRRVINDLTTRSTKGLLFYVVIAFVVFFNDDFYQRHPRFALVFIAVIAGVCGIRGLHVALMPWLNRNWENASNRFFLFTVVLTALSWGTGFALFMIQDGEHPAKLLMAICSTGLCAGGIVAFIPGRMLSVVFNVLMLIPCAVSMWIMTDNYSMALMIALFSLYMILVSLRGNAEYWDALENEFFLGQKSRELEKISRMDVLTGLFNRRHFDEIFNYQWNLSLREQRPLTLIIADIDHFKRINDTHGHLAGDAFLKGTAMILENVFKRETDIVARFGGEEFIVLLGNTDKEPARMVAEEFRSAMAAFSLPHRDEALRATVSLGIASCIPDPGRTGIQLISEADQALYRAKREGRNRVRLYGQPV